MEYLSQPSYARFPDIIRADYYGYYFGSPAVVQPEVTVSSRPVADYLLCFGDTVKISVAGNYNQYQWNDGSVEPIRSFTKEGIYWVYKIKDCHIDIDSFNVITPRVDFLENDTLLCRLQSMEITLHAQSNIPGSYAWNTGATGDSITVDQSGLYVFTQTNECGAFSDSVNVIFNEQCDCRPFIPNAFSPNGDGLNDVLSVRSICQTSVYFMSIYNRYGQRIFFSDHIDESWDGTWNRKQVAAGTYYYILNYEALGNIRFLLKGDVVLIR
jgi:gliding motility-associated-like protein